MKHRIFFLFLFFVVPIFVQAQSKEPIFEKYYTKTQQIIAQSLKDSSVYSRLSELVDRFPARISGSDNLENAIDWIVQEMKNDGFDAVYTQPVLVPKWIRGSEYIELNTPVKKRIPMLGLGGSVGTGKKGITAQVVVFHSLEELKSNVNSVKGKIVLVNQPFETYGKTVAIRSQSAIEAAKGGAVAAIIRSVASFSMQTPHTGMMRYDDSITKIPSAAITPEDADWIQRTIERGESVEMKLYMEAKFEKDVLSRNVIAELKGSEKPDEYVVLGGHIDSWDVGQGAMDDAGGCVVSWEVLNILKQLNFRPKRSIRVVFWTNEENGLRGGQTYRDSVATSLDKHVAAIESDAGIFKAKGFGFGGKPENMPLLQEVAKLLQSIEAGSITQGGGGADIGPLMRDGVPGFGLNVNGEKYFWYHHTTADTIDKLDPYEANTCVAAMSVLSFVLADMESVLIR